MNKRKMLLSATHLHFRRGRNVVLDDVSLQLARYEVVALIGANGAGKSTLLHLLAGEFYVQRGELQRSCAPQQIALLADRAALYPDWCAGEALGRLAQLYEVEHAVVETLIDEFALRDVLLRRACELSHGYQQRLAMAQMLLRRPELMLLDEPGNGLDYEQRRALWPLLRRLKLRGAVLLISHDWTEVAAVADRVYLLQRGHCHEIVLPPRQPDWLWLSYTDDKSALDACPQAELRDGRFVAIRRGQLYASTRLCSLTAHYPAQALQEKIDALA